MLTHSHAQGCADAYARFSIKEAGISIGNTARAIGSTAKDVGRMLIGHPDKVLREGKKTFQPGGMLSAKNVWWPDVGKGQRLNWLARAGTVAAPLSLYSAMKNDHRDGHLATALGTLGSIAGSAYGFPAVGAIGGTMLGQLGGDVGRGVGRRLGSHPTYPQYTPPPAPPAAEQEGSTL